MSSKIPRGISYEWIQMKFKSISGNIPDRISKQTFNGYYNNVFLHACWTENWPLSVQLLSKGLYINHVVQNLAISELHRFKRFSKISQNYAEQFLQQLMGNATRRSCRYSSRNCCMNPFRNFVKSSFWNFYRIQLENFFRSSFRNGPMQEFITLKFKRAVFMENELVFMDT